jgi:hypothetical protein
MSPINGKIYKLASNIIFARNFAGMSSTALKYGGPRRNVVGMLLCLRAAGWPKRPPPVFYPPSATSMS